jgi:hypothetical protein
MQFQERYGDDLLPITNPDPDALNAWVVREVVYDGGRFVQTVPGEWTRHEGDSQVVFGDGDDRSEWTINIYTLQNGLDNFEVDLANGIIRSLSLGDPDRPILEVR